MQGVVTRGFYGSQAKPLLLGVFALAFLAYAAFAIPGIASYDPPTLPNNSITNLNWTLVNITSTEDLNQSLLEWGNSTGFTNFSMSNTSMRNWNITIMNLSDWTYNYTVFLQNATGSWSQSARRLVTIDTAPPYNLSACQDLIIENGSYVLIQNVSSAGTCFNILANNITLDGQGYWVNYSQAATGYAINITNRNTTTLKNMNIVQGNSTDGADAIEGVGMAYSTINNNTITTSGDSSYGIFLRSSSNSNTISNNNIGASGVSAYGVYLGSSSDANIFSGNNITASGTDGSGINLQSGSNNITGGSITSRQGYDYFLKTAGSTNNFTNTNFTAQRRIGFNEATSWFNYNNDSSRNIWLSTNISASGSLNRTLSTWSNSTMSWNDTNSTAGLVANYIITGLSSGAKYAVFNSSAGSQSNPYNLTADSSGDLQAFTIALNGNTGINVTDIFPPSITFVSPTWANNSAIPENWTVINVTLSEIGGAAWINWTNNTGSYNLTMSAGSGKTFNLNVTTTTNATYFVYANDTLGNMNVSETRFVKFNTPNYPQYSSVTHNSTQKNSSTLFSASWTDIVGLAGYIFSTNNSNGTWYNYTYAFSGLSNTSNATITLNSTIGTSVSYLFYANNTYGRWSNTSMQTLTVSCTDSWTYSSWTTCSSGTQTRTATETSNCGGLVTGNRLALSQPCTDNTTTPGSSGGNNQPISSFAAFPNDVVTKIKINLKVALTSPSVAVSKLTAAPASVSAPVEKVYQYLSITKTNFIDVNIDNATIEFSVTKSWMTSNSLTNISLARYDGTKWNKLKTEFVSSTSDMNKYVAYTTAFSYFAILGEKASSAPATTPPPASNSTITSSTATQSNETANNTATDGLLSGAPKPGSSIFSMWTLVGVAIAIILSAAAYIISKKGVGGLSGLLPKKKEGGGIPGKNNAPVPWSIPERKPGPPKNAPSPVPVDNDTERRKKTFYSYQGS